MSKEWAFFFSITLSLFMAVIFVALSGKKGGQLKYNNQHNKWGIARKVLCYMLGLYLIIVSLVYYPSQYDFLYEYHLNSFMYSFNIGMGFFGNAIYLSTNADIIFEDEMPDISPIK